MTPEIQKLVNTLKSVRLQCLEVSAYYLQQIHSPIYGVFAAARAIDNANYVKELDAMIAELEADKS